MTKQYASKNKHKEIIKLPGPRYDSKISIEKALLKRRSIREYLHEPLSLAEVSQLLWAAQGITGQYGVRNSTFSRSSLST